MKKLESYLTLEVKQWLRDSQEGKPEKPVSYIQRRSRGLFGVLTST